MSCLLELWNYATMESATVEALKQIAKSLIEINNYYLVCCAVFV